MRQRSKEYGEALFELAMENGMSEEYGKALDTVAFVFDENPEYMEFLSSPSIPMTERIDAIEKAFFALPAHIVSFLSLLCERGRIREFTTCMEEYKALLDSSKQICVARVTSAVELMQEEKEKLRAKLEKKNAQSVILDCSVDESLLGGIIIEMDGKIMDGSVRRHLKEVKEVISG